ITSNNTLVKDSGSTVTDLVMKIVKNIDGNFYMYGNTGKIYKRTDAGAYSVLKTVSNSVGNGMEIFEDELWYASKNALGTTTELSTGTPTFQDNYLVTPLYEAP